MLMLRYKQLLKKTKTSKKAKITLTIRYSLNAYFDGYSVTAPNNLWIAIGVADASPNWREARTHSTDIFDLVVTN
ncbi:hypothetical protein COV88_03945 [Candidatus Saccharibacteria bacterium CG11_big_fil_rev_8_21_14_0_20_41_19]|nr:hypothetical protein [Candidatus Saccharibacteria bacterium]OIP85699.1 MAG: hypothetical protein AUK57_02455 [Candidatus Saccharibacteria bacterium CG2_30_41_52]PIQ70570.1 MAG: hypothetical protein COV88_03945 [Candidatus Saccharibacteria bacterium CG11_big_fil_rev_8_21_14_0_20_41_19]PJE66356.1 MAG: hypothetical protein COU92_00925 [Candidatus Saccharibacteria bacterium CG10_big_fil_rev_8_21_14_0_10_41_32]